jgi:hypothetical protein
MSRFLWVTSSLAAWMAFPGVILRARALLAAP